jgi:hypothetical protein
VGAFEDALCDGWDDLREKGLADERAPVRA